MNARLFFTYLVIASVSLLSLGNKNGRASSANKGNTGAPGDETSLGLPKTCMNCHNQGPIVADVEITVLDADSVAITAYKPGETYTAQVKIMASGPDLQGYGFQMIALRNNGNTDLDGFKDMNPNNYKIASISNGRTYAEHDNISSSNLFKVTWVAPPGGTGGVTFYAAGNGVNKNGMTSGDGAGVDSLQLNEFGTSPSSEPNINETVLMVSPNPIADLAKVTIAGSSTSDFSLSAYDNRGVLFLQKTVELVNSDAQIVEVSTAGWPPGIYYFTYETEKSRKIVKTIKL
ncbi:MAG: hypothetical protein H6576_11165 [Lewinellaceae bacterium]|nr:hypothetical protein [Saprospiraceae bacterium]MCB9344251.1 hypothetical protein [Lewinellaceae bacterium]